MGGADDRTPRRLQVRSGSGRLPVTSAPSQPSSASTSHRHVLVIFSSAQATCSAISNFLFLGNVGVGSALPAWLLLSLLGAVEVVRLPLMLVGASSSVTCSSPATSGRDETQWMDDTICCTKANRRGTECETCRLDAIPSRDDVQPTNLLHHGARRQPTTRAVVLLVQSRRWRRGASTPSSRPWAERGMPSSTVPGEEMGAMGWSMGRPRSSRWPPAPASRSSAIASIPRSPPPTAWGS